MTTSDRVELNYLVEGPEDAPVLVLANSLGTALGMWDDQARTLRERFRLLRYDHRGHGGSSVPPGPYEIEDLGRDVLALLDRLEVERVSFCGHSIGGMVGMWLASEAPERIERLVLCCTSAKFTPPEMWEERARTVRADGAETVEWAGRMLRETPPEGYAGCCETIRYADLRGRLGEISAPTLVIVGADDPAVPLEQAELLRDSIPGARLLVVEGAAHLPNVERPEKITRAVLAHLGTVSEGRVG